jgi:hypothetical protein
MVAGAVRIAQETLSEVAGSQCRRIIFCFPLPLLRIHLEGLPREGIGADEAPHAIRLLLQLVCVGDAPFRRRERHGSDSRRISVNHHLDLTEVDLESFVAALFAHALHVGFQILLGRAVGVPPILRVDGKQGIEVSSQQGCSIMVHDRHHLDLAVSPLQYTNSPANHRNHCGDRQFDSHALFSLWLLSRHISVKGAEHCSLAPKPGVQCHRALFELDGENGHGAPSLQQRRNLSELSI